MRLVLLKMYIFWETSALRAN